ncbi:MAG: YbgA family protein [Anaerolineae bacterium]
MLEFVKPVVVVSQCLGFAACRWDESSVQSETVSRLKDYVEYRTVCPELAIGMGVPRPPIKIVSSADRLSLCQPETGCDLTEPMSDFCQTHLEQLGPVDGFILKARSPSCGTRDVQIFSENGSKTLTSKGSGFYGRVVMARYATLPVEDEIRLENDRIREHFYTRLFTQSRFRLAVSKSSMRELVRFHTEQKLLLMAYNQTAFKRLGHIIANPEKHRVSDVLIHYASQLYPALAHPPRQTSVINTLMHTQEEFSVKLSAAEKAHFLETLNNYRAGSAPLSMCLRLVQDWARRFRHTSLQRQSFVHPFPAALVGDNY